MRGSVTLAQVLQDNFNEVVEKINSSGKNKRHFDTQTLLCPISENGKHAISQSMMRKEGNTKLNDHLIMEVEDVQTVRKTSEVVF